MANLWHLFLIAQETGVFVDEWLVTLIVSTLLAAGVGIVSWTVRLLWQTSNNLARIEERMDDLERRIDDVENGRIRR